MKTFLKFLALPAVFQILLCSSVLAKKDKSDDSDDTKDKRKMQTSPEQLTPAPGKTAQPGPTKQKKAQKAAADPAPRKKKKAAADPAPQKKKKASADPASQKKKKKAASAETRNQDPPSKPKADPSSPKKKASQADPAPKKKSKKETRTAEESTNGKGSKGKEPMTLPGKRPSKDTADTKGKSDRSDKKSDKPNKPNKPLDLPGKRPNVPATAKAADSNRRIEGVRPHTAEEKKAAVKRKNELAAKHVVRPGQNTRVVRRPDLQKNSNNNWWNNNKRVTNNNNVQINRNTTVINRNFQRNVNWTTGRRNWGYNPWWNRSQVRPWYGSSWNGSWNRSYYRRSYNYGYYGGYRPPGYVSVGTAIGWGLVGWSLGTLVYDTGYHTYHNPYPVRTQVSYRGSNFDYSQPITRVAVNTAPDNDDAVEEITRKSESIIAESQSAFKDRNYLVALELADKAIAESPGDGALHEYRALVLFALGKYGDAAGVLNPVLASGPGWDWSTMVALYDSQKTYTDQLQRLEEYTESKPDEADTHFLLGYHYMVCGHTDLSTPQFELAAKLMPSDSVSRQLADLTRSTSDPAASADQPDEAAPAAAEAPAEAPDDAPEAEPVPLEKLTGTWTSTREQGGSITLTFKDDGKFTWSYDNDGKTTEFTGDYSMNDDGLLVLDSDESQMVASVAQPTEQELKFILAGGPPEDPGLDFTKG